MYDIVSLFSVLYPHLSRTTVRQFSQVVSGLLAMTGQVTMLNISRWTSEGGSYRTLQRFFNTVMPWGSLFWVFFRTYLLDRESTYPRWRRNNRVEIGAIQLWFVAFLLAPISSLETQQPCRNRGNPVMVCRVSSRLRKVKRCRA